MTTPASTPPPILYIKAGCPWCRDAITWLDQRGLRYQPIDVLTDPAAYNTMKKLSGQNLTPTIVYPDGRLLADFDTGQLETWLTQQGLPS